MCLIIFNYQPESQYPLVVAANRDEFYRRAASPLAWWANSNILAGRDLGYSNRLSRLWAKLTGRQKSSYGTWLGVNRNGRFAALTNFREPGKLSTSAKSRGLLVSDFLENAVAPEKYALQLEASASEYNGYNLLFGDQSSLRWFSNRTGKPATILKPGLYGVSNALLDTPWQKVKSAKSALSKFLPHPTPDEAFSFMADATPAADGDVQQTGLPFAVEKSLSPAFVKLPNYGTRVTSYLVFSKDGHNTFSERAYGKGKKYRDRQFNF